VGLPSDEYYEEFVECIELSDDIDLCHRMYPDIPLKVVQVLKMCDELCDCDDFGIWGVKPEYQDFCERNCVCVEE